MGRFDASDPLLARLSPCKRHHSGARRFGPPPAGTLQPPMHGGAALAQRPKERRRDPRRRAAVDIALSLAELNAGLGDYDRALEHLSAADQLTGGVLGSRFQPQRESWVEQAARTPAPVMAAVSSPL